MNLIFYNYFGGLVTTKSIVSNQIMITRKAASDMVESAIEIGKKAFFFFKTAISYFMSKISCC